MRITPVIRSPLPTFRSLLMALTAAAWIGTAGVPLSAQTGNASNLQDLFDQGQNQPGDSSPELDVSVSLTATEAEPGEEAVLAVTVKLPSDFYIYSTNRSFGGATKFTVSEAAGLTPLDEEFTADRAPKVAFEPLFEQEVEKFHDQVTWYRKYRIDADAVVEQVSISGQLEGQYCSDGESGQCIPIRPPHQFEVALTEGPPPDSVRRLVESSGVHPFRFEHTPTRRAGGEERPDPMELQFELSPQDARPGERVTLAITANVEDEWHTFALTQDPKNSGLPTEITLEGISGLAPVGGFEESAPPTIEQTFDGKEQRTHYGEITWSREFEVLPSAEEGDYGVHGKIRVQLCTHGRCLSPRMVEFSLGDLTRQTTFTETSELESSSLVFDSAAQTGGGLAWYLLAAFLGGFILNFMPCVLPVIAIKVRSFVQQAGESPGRVFLLNIAYSLGVISVFLVLATLVAGVFSEKLGWGELFQFENFNLVMTLILFAMALWLLGVFELQVPGVVGSAASSQQGEGVSGAFLTGVFATLLATPCSGPFLGATLAFAASQPALTTYLIFGMMGLGMASPYLVFSVFPGAVGWLPKPGDWMVRFKEFCGFVLLGTVVFFLFILQNQGTDPIPVLLILLGVGLGLWMIGSLYHLNSSFRRKLIVRLTALSLAGVIGFTGYGLAGGVKLPWQDVKLPWENFSEQNLQASLADNRTVLIDFTADWCLTCKYNEFTALNTRRTLALVEEHDIVPLYADYTNHSEEIKRWLDKFDSISVPLTVIFPGDRPEEPIVLRDTYTQATLLEKLNEAVSPNGGAASDRPRVTSLK